MAESDNLSAESHIDLEEPVRRRAYEIWQSHQNGNGEPTALDDWLQAKREVLGADSNVDAQNRATVVGSARRPDWDQVHSLGEA